MLLPDAGRARAGRASSLARTAATPCGSARPRRSALLAPALRARPASGAWWRARTGTRSAGRCCRAPRQVLRRIGRDADVVTYISELHPRPARRRARARPALEPLPPGVDADAFRPDPAAGRRAAPATGWATRRWWCACRGWSPARARTCWSGPCRGCGPGCPGRGCCSSAAGPTAARCAGWPPRTGWPTHVVFTGSVAGRRAAGALRGRRRLRDALPHPRRRAGRRGAGDGLPRGGGRRACRWSPGDSGGAPEAVQEGVTGHVVDGRGRQPPSPTPSPACSPTRRGRGAMGAAGPGVDGAALVVDGPSPRLRALLGAAPERPAPRRREGPVSAGWSDRRVERLDVVGELLHDDRRA